MSEQIITKICRVCKQTKPLSDFYKRKNSKDGYRNECKACCCKRINQYCKEYHQTERGKAVSRKATLRYEASEKGKACRKHYWQSKNGKATQKHYQQSEKGKATYTRYYTRHPRWHNARIAVKDAIRVGKLPRPDTLQCHYCPEQANQYHHHKGYEPEHWLDVLPVCRKCHIIQHLSQNKASMSG